MHVIARPNHPLVISLPHEFQHLLLFVLRWRKVNWKLHVGWRLRVACMWLCVLYSSPLFLQWQMGFASSRSDSLLLSLQMAFASTRSHYRMNVTVCFVFPSPLFCLQMAFASPRSHSFSTA